MLNLDGFKKVDFHGIDLWIPEKHYYVFCDMDGEVRSSATKPDQSEICNYWLSEYAVKVGITGRNNNWRDTLIELPKPFVAKGFKAHIMTVKAWGHEFTVPLVTTQLAVSPYGLVFATCGSSGRCYEIGMLDLDGQEPPEPVLL